MHVMKMLDSHQTDDHFARNYFFLRFGRRNTLYTHTQTEKLANSLAMCVLHKPYISSFLTL